MNLGILFLSLFIFSCEAFEEIVSNSEDETNTDIENTESDESEEDGEESDEGNDDEESESSNSSYDYLIMFDADSYPLDTDTWTILDETATTEDFAGLSAAIASVSTTTPEREISLIFPNLDNIPDYAIFGEATHSDTFASSAIVSLTANNAGYIGAYSFYMCTSLKSVEATSALEVGYYAFYGCTSLESVILPSATAVDEEAFSECESLTEVSIPNCTTISLPSTTSIGGGCFSSNTSITTVYAGSAIMVGGYAFSDCSSLSYAKISSVEIIGDYAFYNCSVLSSINMSLVKSIGMYAFGNCVSLPSLDIPVVTSIGVGAFSNCSLIPSVELPLLTTLEDLVFYQCSSLESVTLAQVESLGSSSLGECSSLVTLSLATDDGVKLSYIATDAFKDTNTSLVTLTVGLENAEYVDGNTLTIGNFSAEFKEIIVLGLESVTDDDDVIYEGGGVFTLATIPTNGAIIEDDVWIITDEGDPTSLEFVNLKSALSSAGDNREISIYMPNVTSIPDYAVTTHTDIYGSPTNIINYNLTQFSAPKATTVGTCAFCYCYSLKDLSLPLVTYINHFYAFSNCDALESISLPSATFIGSCAFSNCDALESVSLPEATSIESSAFTFCYALKSISMQKVTSIGYSAFSGCSSLESISLPMATSIGYYAFRYCAALKSVSLATESTSLSVSSSAFYSCTLSDIDLETGANNGSTVDGNYWTVESNTFGEFKSITVK
ncbi:MAG: leucine-rich repeat protein [Rikenellaceae bacterium]